MSSFSEDDVQRAAEMREWLIKEISEKEEELDRLRNILILVDSILRRSSFKTASAISREDQTKREYPASTGTQPITQAPQNIVAQREMGESESQSNKAPEMEAYEIRELRSAKDNLLLAKAEIWPDDVKITVNEELSLNVNTSPFKSFFLNRILEGMKSKDLEKIRSGYTDIANSIDYQIHTDNQDIIKSINVTNYRERERLQDILSTVTWVLTKMVEKSSQKFG